MKAQRTLVAVGLALFLALMVPTVARSAGADVTTLMWSSAVAEKIYISPRGAGKQDGTSPNNAFAFSSLPSHLRGLKRSTTIHFSPGTYRLQKTLRLTAPTNGVLHLKGASGVEFKGQYQFGRRSDDGSGIRLESGNIVIEDIAFENTRACVRTNARNAVTNVYLKGIEGHNVHSCIVTYRNSDADVRRWTIDGLKVKGYYQVGIRLAGRNTSDIKLENIDLDGAHAKGPDDCYKGGIQLLAGVSTVVIASAKIVNNVGDCDAFQQGDGIEADDKGGTPRDIVIVDTYVANTGDANLDLKADHVYMRNVETDGGKGSHYNYKLWNYDNYLCVNCGGRGEVISNIILVGSEAVFLDPLFASDKADRLCELRQKKRQTKLTFINDNERIDAKHLNCSVGK